MPLHADVPAALQDAIQSCCKLNAEVRQFCGLTCDRLAVPHGLRHRASGMRTRCGGGTSVACAFGAGRKGVTKGGNTCCCFDSPLIAASRPLLCPQERPEFSDLRQVLQQLETSDAAAAWDAAREAVPSTEPRLIDLI